MIKNYDKSKIKEAMLNKNVIETLHDKAKLFEAKTNDYGNAWAKQGSMIKGMIGGKDIVCETEQDINEFQLFGRVLEKMVRYANLRFGRTKSKVKEESITETLEDICIQVIMMSVLNKHSKTEDSSDLSPEVTIYKFEEDSEGRNL